jgi:hypothetical protein
MEGGGWRTMRMRSKAMYGSEAEQSTEIPFHKKIMLKVSGLAPPVV